MLDMLSIFIYFRCLSSLVIYVKNDNNFQIIHKWSDSKFQNSNKQL